LTVSVIVAKDHIHLIKMYT